VVKRILVLCVIYLVCNSALPVISEATDPQVLKPRVPADQIDEVRTWVNPFSSTSQNIEKGKALFHGKAFCVTCHGKDGKGYDHIPGLRGKLPRNFTDKSCPSVVEKIILSRFATICIDQVGNLLKSKERNSKREDDLLQYNIIAR